MRFQRHFYESEIFVNLTQYFSYNLLMISLDITEAAVITAMAPVNSPYKIIYSIFDSYENIPGL